MATLTYAICSETIQYEGSYTAIVSSLNDIGAIKTLYVELDPSTDPSILDPSETYDNYSTG